MKKSRLLVAFALVSFVVSVGLLVSRVSAPSIMSFIVTLHSCNKDGVAKNTFGFTEDVYVFGDGYWANEQVTVRVIPSGLPYWAQNSVRNVVTQASGTGHLGPVKLGAFGMGEYDIWVDRNGNGLWDQGMPRPEPAAGFGCEKGFFVVPEYWLGTILGLGGCFAALGAFRFSKRKHL